MLNSKAKIAVVAIARDERPFLDEWVLYHLHVGADQIIVYDDDPEPGLQEFLRPHGEKVKVVRWFDQHQDFPGCRGDRQTKAYLHSLPLLREQEFQWVAFIDVDEFIVLEQHGGLREFLSYVESSRGDAVALNEYLFGHNGHYDDLTKGLVTSEFVRRKKDPSPHYKCITKVRHIAGIESVHLCRLIPDSRLVDANRMSFRDYVMYSDKTEVAHLNHYMCRSFTRWMRRPARGDACDVPSLPENAWKITEEGCLRKFVEEVAVRWNEHADDYMLRFQPILTKRVKEIKDTRTTSSPEH